MLNASTPAFHLSVSTLENDSYIPARPAGKSQTHSLRFSPPLVVERGLDLTRQTPGFHAPCSAQRAVDLHVKAVRSTVRGSHELVYTSALSDMAVGIIRSTNNGRCHPLLASCSTPTDDPHPRRAPWPTPLCGNHPTRYRESRDGPFILEGRPGRP